jgi:SulP family sulfate permease
LITREFGRHFDRKIKKIEKENIETKRVVIYGLHIGFIFCSLNALWTIIICTGISDSIYAKNPKIANLPIVGTIPQGLPIPVAPNATALAPIMSSLVGNAIVIAILAFVEAYSIARKLAENKGYARDLDAGQELLALGLSNFLSSFFGGFSISGSYSRTMVNEKAGAQSSISAFVVGLIVLLSCYVISAALYYLPSATLSAIVCVAASALIDIAEYNRVRKVSTKDFLTAVATFCATVALGPALGFLIGLCISFASLLTVAAFPHIAVLGWVREKDSTGASKVVFRNPKRFKDANLIDEVAVLRLDAPLWFGNSEVVLERCFKETRGKKLLVLDASAISSIDLTGLRALSSLEDRTKKRTGAGVAIANVNDNVKDAINRFNVSYGAIGITNIAGTGEKQTPVEASTDTSAVAPIEGGIKVFHSVVDALQSHGYNAFDDSEAQLAKGEPDKSYSSVVQVRSI